MLGRMTAILAAFAAAQCGVVVNKGSKQHTMGCTDIPFSTSTNSVEMAERDEAVASVRCCTDDGTGAEFFGAGCTLYTYMEADAKCAMAGMRLCTEMELEAEAPMECDGSSNAFVWTSTDCTFPTPAPSLPYYCDYTIGDPPDFIETDIGLPQGLLGVVVEPEQLALPAGWAHSQDFEGYTGTGYIEWEGDTEHVLPCDCAVIEFDVQIVETGRKRIMVRGSIGNDERADTNNDAWLRVPQGVVYAQRGTSQSWVEGNMACDDNGTAVDCLPYMNGPGEDNWIKFYSYGRVQRWLTKTKASDSDTRDIFVEFDAPGVYTFQLSPRSLNYRIDRIVVFEQPEGLTTNQIISLQNAAMNLDQQATRCGATFAPTAAPWAPSFAPTPSPVMTFHCNTSYAQAPDYLEVDLGLPHNSKVVVIEAEDLSFSPTSGWVMNTDHAGYVGSGFIEWAGNQPYFQVCDCKKISFWVEFVEAGRKRIQIRGWIGGQHVADNNDVFLRVLNVDLFAQRQGSNKKWPRDNERCTNSTTGAAIDCTPYVNGESGMNYLKVYTQGNIGEWEWKTKASDNDARDVYIDVATPGVYRVQLGARSRYYGIDRIVINGQPESLSVTETVEVQAGARDVSLPSTRCS